MLDPDQEQAGGLVGNVPSSVPRQRQVVAHTQPLTAIVPKQSSTEIHEQFPQACGNCVVPSPLTSGKPFTSHWNAKFIPPGAAFHFEPQMQLPSDVLAQKPFKRCGIISSLGKAYPRMEFAHAMVVPKVLLTPIFFQVYGSLELWRCFLPELCTEYAQF